MFLEKVSECLRLDKDRQKGHRVWMVLDELGLVKDRHRLGILAHERDVVTVVLEAIDKELEEDALNLAIDLAVVFARSHGRGRGARWPRECDGLDLRERAIQIHQLYAAVSMVRRGAACARAHASKSRTWGNRMALTCSTNRSSNCFGNGMGELPQLIRLQTAEDKNETVVIVFKI